MREIGAAIKDALGKNARLVPSRSIPNFVLRVVSLFNAELRPFIPDLGYAKKTSNEKARRMLDWRPRDAREAIVAAAESMVGVV